MSEHREQYDLVADAMQSAWNDFVGDTGCYPDCFEYKGGKLHADFRIGNFSRMVAGWLGAHGHVIIPDEPHHYVTFDQGGWFIEHSVACRVAGTIGTCNFNAAIREIAEDFDPDEDPDQLGRWRITWIDGEGLPSLERAHISQGSSHGD